VVKYGKRRNKMIARTKQKKDVVSVKQYVTDKRGHKVAAILDIDELKRIETLIENLSDLKAIEDRVAEPEEDYEAYGRKRKSRLNV
jgi:hypothetical protein